MANPVVVYVDGIRRVLDPGAVLSLAPGESVTLPQRNYHSFWGTGRVLIGEVYCLEWEGVPYQYLDGATPPDERRRRVAAFQAGEGDCFLISLKAGGTGLNLTAADYVVHMDPWWNPAVEK